jgi:hypothetical protein
MANMTHFTRTAVLPILLALATQASAQSAPISRTIPVTFTGVVVDDVANTIKIRQPDGSFANFTGPVPDYPYKKGDAVTLSFNATVPTQAFYQPGGPYTGQVAADGIYKIGIASPAYTGGTTPGGVGNMGAIDVSGPIRPVDNNGQPTNLGGFTIVYDSNADSYSLEFPSGQWTAGKFDGPGYGYDAATGTVSATNTTCTSANCADGGMVLTGNSTGFSATNAPVSGSSGGIAGFFSALFSGTWNLPTWTGNGSGGSTDVPEPGMAVLFGSGALALLARRRKRVKG